MSISLDKSLGLPAQALKLQAKRSQLLASNIANADTPHYKARDFDFGSVLRQARTGGVTLRTTNTRHIDPVGFGVGNPTIKYRVPANPSLDGNTVELDRERSRFAQNTLQYQAALHFLGGRIRSLLGAIKGE
ncbi:MAG: flagellar basal body rod protein FlgB [Nitrococcus sp.]|nr:flagellar basal body rod protein FlgB [Nitrococcus sp.]